MKNQKKLKNGGKMMLCHRCHTFEGVVTGQSVIDVIHVILFLFLFKTIDNLKYNMVIIKSKGKNYDIPDIPDIMMSDIPILDKYGNENETGGVKHASFSRACDHNLTPSSTIHHCKKCGMVLVRRASIRTGICKPCRKGE